MPSNQPIKRDARKRSLRQIAVGLRKRSMRAASKHERKQYAERKKRAGYSQKDLRDVSDNLELTKANFAKAKPFAEVFPDIAASIRKGRGPNKAPTKKLVSLRLSPEVIEHFKATGDGWQSRIDETLRKVVKRRVS